MKLLPLIQGLFAKVDDDVFEWASRYNWSINSGATKKYIYRNTGGTVHYLHREVMGNPKGYYVDHRFADVLDCQRKNLRLATRVQNVANRQPRPGKVKGVQYKSRSQKWEAFINHHGKRHGLGLFDTQTEAANAYDQEAVRLYGEFAWTNGGAEDEQREKRISRRNQDKMNAKMRRHRKVRGLPTMVPKSSLANTIAAPERLAFPIFLPEKTLLDESEWRQYLHEELQRVKGQQVPSGILGKPAPTKPRPTRLYSLPTVSRALGIPRKTLLALIQQGQFGELETRASKSSLKITETGFKQFTAGHRV